MPVHTCELLCWPFPLADRHSRLNFCLTIASVTSRWLVWILWAMAEVAIAATDLAEVIGSATALYLLFGLPLWAGVLITVVDVLLILAFGTRSFRIVELIVFMLVATIAG